jgi:hypothetical protein
MDLAMFQDGFSTFQDGFAKIHKLRFGEKVARIDGT